MSDTTTTQPTAEAVKAAEVIWHQIERGLHDGTLTLEDGKVTPPPDKLANLIDRKTGLPALLAANKRLQEARSYHGCTTGDCPHDDVNDCVKAMGLHMQEMLGLLDQAQEIQKNLEAERERLRDKLNVIGYGDGATTAQLQYIARAALAATETKP